MVNSTLNILEKRLEKALKKQTQDGLADVFTKLSCKGVASKIKQGKNVTGNAEFGIRFCVHDKLGPRVNVKTMKFSPMTKKAKRIEEKFIKFTNLMLKNGGFREMSPTLLSNLRKKDRNFEKEIKTRRGRR